ncbi:hypothetical protein SLE2022_133810 [Rubroshorea leprosula]
MELENDTKIIGYIYQQWQDPFNFVTAELGLIFDFVYTKSALIYTKTGCFLRLTSFACSSSVLLLFLISIMNESNFHFSRVDIYITSILLGGTISLEHFAAWVMFSSDWAILIATIHNNMLLRKMICVVLKCFPRSMNQRKRWSDHMRQFDLLKYCWQYKKKDVNKSCVCLQKITICSDLIETCHKYMYTKFVKVPTDLQKLNEVYRPDSLVSFSHEGNTIKTSRGERALQARHQYYKLKWSVESDFDYSIIVWHLATIVCYHHDDSRGPKDVMKISKRVSNCMMYLLAMHPTMILPEDGKSFWLDHTYDKLKKPFSDAIDTKEACELLLKLDDDDHEANRESRFDVVSILYS